jgi:hypothetical protein
MREDDFARRGVLALERIADLVEIMLGIASGRITVDEADEDEPVIHAEHETPQ